MLKSAGESQESNLNEDHRITRKESVIESNDDLHHHIGTGYGASLRRVQWLARPPTRLCQT